MWVQIAVYIAMMVVSYLLQPKPKTSIPAASEDIDVPRAQEGGCIPVVFGTRDISSANVAWYGDVRSDPIKKG